MARKGWDSLSPNYRKRLQQGGISRSDYEKGQSLSKARGHESTPEHPRQKVDRDKYARYYAERDILIHQLEAKKRQIFGDSPRWTEERSRSNIRAAPVSNAALRWALNHGEEEWLDAIRQDPEAFRFLCYH